MLLLCNYKSHDYSSFLLLCYIDYLLQKWIPELFVVTHRILWRFKLKHNLEEKLPEKLFIIIINNIFTLLLNLFKLIVVARLERAQI